MKRVQLRNEFLNRIGQTVPDLKGPRIQLSAYDFLGKIWKHTEKYIYEVLELFKAVCRDGALGFRKSCD